MSYRKIWMKHNGDIPKDEKGRMYEIHHIDGNRANNQLENLQCVSIEEHLRIHLLQGDYHAAKMISGRLGYSIKDTVPMPEEKREEIRNRMLGDNNPMKRPEVAQKVSIALKGRKKSTEAEAKRIKSREGFKHSKETILKMKKPKSQVTCPHCQQIGGSNGMKRWHFEQCKHKK